MSSISVIIPTFNRRTLIGQTLESVLRQTHKPAEVIVVDDHSTDGTFDYVKQNFPGVILIKNSGKGPGAARNRGVSIATGSYIKFFDSDDVLTLNSLEVQLKTLQAEKKEFVYSPYFRARQEGGSWHPLDNIVMHYYPFSRSRALSHFMITDGLFIAIPGMLFTRKVIEEAGPWREDATAYEDFDYLFRLSMIEPRPAHTNECAFVYRIHGAQSTESNFSDEQRDQDKIRVLNDLHARTHQLGTFNQMLFANKFYQLYRDSPSAAVRSALTDHNTVVNRALWEMLRLKSRFGRMTTKTVWQPSHGPLDSRAQISEYLKLLN